jgi:signal transduction histidine kinase/ligand-binding sensor domain-containing protein/DNA-binding response OmpR family regulator
MLPNVRIRSIVQDQQGFLWLNSNTNLWRFDGYNLQVYTDFLDKSIDPTSSLTELSHLFVGHDDTLWITSKHKGLIKLNNHSITAYQHQADNKHSISSNYVSAFIELNNNNIWLGTKNGLNHFFNGKFTHYPLPSPDYNLKDNFITSIVSLSEQELLVASKNNLFSFNIETKAFTQFRLPHTIDDFFIYNIYKDNDNKTWLATNQGVFVMHSYAGQFNAYKPEIINFSVPSILVDKQNIWLGSILNGLYKISKKDGSIQNFKHKAEADTSISDDNITSLTLDNHGVLWISSFNGGVNYIDTNTLNFNLASISSTSLYCSKSSVIYGFEQDGDDIWLASEKGLIKYNEQKNNCQFIDKNTDNTPAFSQNIPFSINIDSQRQKWITSSDGLNVMRENNMLVDDKIHHSRYKNSYFSSEYQANLILFGTDKGLYIYHDDSQIVEAFAVIDLALSHAKFNSYIKDSHNNYFFATNLGVAFINSQGQLVIQNKIQSQLPTQEISSLLFRNDELWIGTSLNGLFHFDSNLDLIQHYDVSNGVASNLSIQSMQSDQFNHLWIATENGLINLHPETNWSHTFHLSDGLQNDYFLRSSSYKANDGRLYFGGNKGYNAFYPEDIKTNQTAPEIVLTNFTRFGKSVAIGVENDGFVLSKPINQLEQMTLGHKDYVIGFEFSALDYTDSSRNQYAYMMQGLDPDWIYVDASDRKISYSNLAAGNYVFKVIGTNKDGIWNKAGKSLKITVRPAPWLSWWAYSAYTLLFFSLLFWYINRKNRANARITQLLRTEVAKQTKQLQIQKQKVENLLVRKNELFANVSHEFRTPLTLILGPINKLLNTPLSVSEINALKMVNRNANRLLTMIEQILQIAKISDNENIKFYPQKTKLYIETIVETFKPLANEKNLDLQLANCDDAAVSTSKDAIEMIIGNLLSNAIKYTPAGGRITVSAKTKDNKLYIEVSDTGCGLSQSQQKDIFNRFTRLDTHKNIEGIGIGLSVVEELLKVNNADITITSTPDVGSRFIVCFHCIDIDFEDRNDQSNKMSNSLLLKQLTHETIEIHNPNFSQQDNNKQGENILIIEDNHDMRLHIADTLKDNYQCLLAQEGKEGIALAIEHVPDIIICDVMMPGMDGFQVCRVIRSDTRTSHIPLVLLTALEDRKSRIRGWREHVDAYLTKPFDAAELLLQLENILVIRNILKTKAGQQVKVGNNTAHIDLPKKDQQFIQKLNNIITHNYKNPLFLRAKLATEMAVSERQLQRKTKALIDKNPMDLLREYRLSQAAIMLKDGYQVSISSDECGFNSVTYFSQCFKAQFGMTPKNYQTTCKNNKN